MEANKQNSKEFTSEQSLKIIFEMIEISKNKLRQDGILFIIWGWVFFSIGVLQFIQQNMVTTYKIRNVTDGIKLAAPLSALIFTVIYILKQRKRVQTFIGKTLRVTWFSMFFCLVLINLVQYNVLGSITFKLQHPIFMVVIAFAIIVTGSILRYNFLIIGGVVFALLALLGSYFKLETQLTLETIGWFVAFVVPGHYLYAKRNKA